MPTEFDELASMLSPMGELELCSILDQALKKAHQGPAADQSGVEHFGLERAIRDGDQDQRKAALFELLTKLRDSEPEGHALGRFLIALKPHLLHRSNAATAVAVLFEKLRFRFPLQSDVYHLPFFHMNPLINRQALRKTLHRFFEDVDTRAHLFVVRATGIDAAYGKTYCRWLVQQVAKDIWGINPIYLDLRDFSTEPGGEDGLGQFKTLCEALAFELGLIAQFNAIFLNTPLRQANQFSSWLAGTQWQEKAHWPARRVIMFDHLSKGRRGVTGILRDLAIHVAKRARDGELGDVYVILLECDDETADILSQGGAWVWDDKPSRLAKEEVKQFLDRVNQILARTKAGYTGIPGDLRKFVDSCEYPLDRRAVMQLNRYLQNWYLQS